MTARVVDGRRLAAAARDEVASDASRLANCLGRPATLAVVSGVNDAAAASYIRRIRREFERCRLGLVEYAPAADDLLPMLGSLGREPTVDGILLQTPLPAGVEPSAAFAAVAPTKDVDGVHPLNAGKLFLGAGDYFAPATPLGGLELLERVGVDPAGSRVVVVGRSRTVGRPMAMMLLQRHATVTVCHRQTRDLPSVVRQADIVVAAAGSARLIKGSWLRPGATVVDFGTNLEGDQIVGDVDFESALEVAGLITPVPGGTGPMTTIALARNTLRAAGLATLLT